MWNSENSGFALATVSEAMQEFLAAGQTSGKDTSWHSYKKKDLWEVKLFANSATCVWDFPFNCLREVLFNVRFIINASYSK